MALFSRGGKKIDYQEERRFATLMIYRSIDPKADPKEWVLVKNDDVPAWLKEPRILGELVDGYIATDKEKSPGVWWRCTVLYPDETETRH